MRTFLLSCSLFFLTLCLFLPGIVSIPLLDRDEAHFTQATKQMLEGGNWFQIRFQEKTRFQKPPGINWLQACVVRAFSSVESSAIWPYRLPSVLGGIFSVLGTFWFARRFFSEASAWCGAALLACTFLLLVEAHLAVIDASLLLSVVLMQGALWMVYVSSSGGQRASKWLAVLFWLAMSYGFLLKGVTPLVGILTILALSIADKHLRWLKELHCFWGIAGFVVLSIAWLYPVNVAEHSNYLLQMFHKDLLPKLVGGHESHGKPPLFHLFALPITFWPASLFLWCAVIVACRKRHERSIRFLLAWILPTWVFFEIMPTKLPQYVLPTFPALALLCAEGLLTIKPNQYWPKTITVLHVLWFVLSLGFITVLAGMIYYLLHTLSVLNLLAGMVLVLLCAVATYCGIQRDNRRTVCITLSVSVLFSWWVFQAVLPSLQPLWLTPKLASAIENNHSQTPLLVIGFEEPSLVFYSGTQRIRFVSKEVALMAIQSEPQQLVLLDEATYNWLKEKMPLVILKQWTGFNYNKGIWQRLFLIRQ